MSSLTTLLLLVAIILPASVYGTVPADLSNVHSRATCPGDVLIVSPATVRDVEIAGTSASLSRAADTCQPCEIINRVILSCCAHENKCVSVRLAVGAYGRVQPNGRGCSWNKVR
jgi:hypothetical protein